jgi:hypothetical protein
VSSNSRNAKPGPPTVRKAARLTSHRYCSTHIDSTTEVSILVDSGQGHSLGGRVGDPLSRDPVEVFASAQSDQELVEHDGGGRSVRQIRPPVARLSQC